MGARGQGAPALKAAAVVAVYRPGADGRRRRSRDGAAGRAMRGGVPARRRARAGGAVAQGGVGMPGAAIGAGGCRRRSDARGGRTSLARGKGWIGTDKFRAWASRAGAGAAGRREAGVPVAGVCDGKSSGDDRIGAVAVGQHGAGRRSSDRGAGRHRWAVSAAAAGHGDGGGRDRRFAASRAVTRPPQCFTIAMEYLGSRLRGYRRRGNTLVRSG